MKDKNNNTNLGVLAIAKQAIDDLLPFAPPDWRKQVAALMGVKVDTINKYYSFKRHGRGSHHKILDVLTHLKRVVEDYTQKTQTILP